MSTETTTERSTLVGVFDDRDAAERCVDDLHRAGFDDDQIGFVSRGKDETHPHTGTEHAQPEGALAGAAGGAVAGGILGGALGALATALIPGIGPVIAAGILAGLVAGAPTGAAVGGIAGALRGAGVPEADAEAYEGNVREGKTLVTVKPGNRHEDALNIIRRDGGRVESGISSAVTRATGTQPAEGQPMELREEQMVPRTEPVQAGEARITKDVVTEPREMEVPVRHEEVSLERHEVEPRTPSQPGALGEGQLRVPVTEDQVTVEKRPVVTGEVHAEKQAVEGSQRVSGEVSKEVPRVESTDESRVQDEETS